MIEKCPYCASSRSKQGPVAGACSYRHCLSCGSGYLGATPMEFRDYYGDYAPKLVENMPDVLLRRYTAMLARLEALAPQRRLLEVGCGNGHFLTVARSRGWDVRGVELSRAHVARAREAGLEVLHGDLVSDRLWEGERFGAAVMIEVLEHVPEPRSLLAGVAARLVPGGVTFLTTPNYGSVTRRLLAGRWSVLSHEHVALASPSGLRRAFSDTGHRALRIRSKSLYLGEYRKLFAPSGGGRSVPLAAENAALRDRIDESAVLSGAKALANVVLGATGLGEALEGWARKVGDPVAEGAL